MKKTLLILFVLMLSLPTFAVDFAYGVYDYSHRGHYSTKPVAVYYTKLYNEYMDKVKKGEIQCSAHTFAYYVDGPTLEFAEQYNKQMLSK